MKIMKTFLHPTSILILVLIQKCTVESVPIAVNSPGEVKLKLEVTSRKDSPRVSPDQQVADIFTSVKDKFSVLHSGLNKTIGQIQLRSSKANQSKGSLPFKGSQQAFTTAQPEHKNGGISRKTMEDSQVGSQGNNTNLKINRALSHKSQEDFDSQSDENSKDSNLGSQEKKSEEEVPNSGSQKGEVTEAKVSNLGPKKEKSTKFEVSYSGSQKGKITEAQVSYLGSQEEAEAQASSGSITNSQRKQEITKGSQPEQANLKQLDSESRMKKNSSDYISSNDLSESESEESEEIPIPWLNNMGRPNETKHRKLDMLNETLDPYKKFNSDDIYDFPDLVPKDGNVSDVKWRDSHWEDKIGDQLGQDGYNLTEGNWTKGFRQVGHWLGPNNTEGTWLEEGLYKGMWSLTKHLGQSVMDIFWTKQFDAQLNISRNGNETSHFVNGNWSEGNSTKEVGIDDPHGFEPAHEIPAAGVER